MGGDVRAGGGRLVGVGGGSVVSGGRREGDVVGAKAPQSPHVRLHKVRVARTPLVCRMLRLHRLCVCILYFMHVSGVSVALSWQLELYCVDLGSQPDGTQAGFVVPAPH